MTIKKFYIFDSDALRNFHKRIFFSITVFIFIYLILFYRIVDIMILEKSLTFSENNENIIKRGNIYDRNDVLLSSTINSYSLSTNPSVIKNKNLLSSKLSLILPLSKEDILSKLNQRKKFVYIKRFISPREHQEIINLGEINLIISEEKTRIYPYGNITSHVVGFTDTDGEGISGVERGLNENLYKGEDIYLSIDVRLQSVFREELMNTINKFSAKSGLVIAFDITSNEIISLNSFPDFDPNNKKTFTEENIFNRALQGNYEMGSTFKPITVAIGIDENIIDQDMSIDVSKPIKKGRRIINDFHPYNGSLSIKDIVVKSSNIGAAKIASKIGKKNQIKFFKKIGFYNKIKLEIAEVAEPLTNKNHWGEVETMTIGYGHGFGITPLHLVSAYASLINNGKKSNPTLLRNNSTNINMQIIKPETSHFFLKLLRAVVLETEYTGPRVKIDGYQIGGKTGTTMLINKFGEYQKDVNLTSFIGVFPISKPKYVILAMVEYPKKIKEENYNVTGASVAAPLVKNLISKMIEILAIPPTNYKEVLKADTSFKYKKINNAAL